VFKLHDVLPHNQTLFPQRLRETGYKTALFGKLHVSGHSEETKHRHPNDGFDIYEWCPDPAIQLDSEFNSYASWLRTHHPDFFAKLQKEKKLLKHFPADAHLSTWAAEQTIQFLEQHDRERPFFCMMSLYDPHDPYHDYPIDSLDSVNLDHLKLPHNHTARPEDVPQGVTREQDKFKNTYTDDEIMAIQLGYHASIGFLDAQFGKVLAKLQQLGLDDNTLVIFLSDHGDMLGDKDLFTKGAYFYDPCVKVPFLMRLPGMIPAGVRRRSLIQPHDIAATCLRLAGINQEILDQWMPHSLDIMPLATGATAVVRDHAVTYYRNSRYWNPEIQCTMFRDNRYKLNVYHDPCLSGGDQEGELFDMQEDPGEINNLWNNAEHAPLKLKLLFRLLDWTNDQENTYRSGRGGENLAVERR
jgi:arylsulfatase